MSSVEATTATRAGEDRAAVVVRFEVPEGVAAEARGADGEIDRDALSDRILLEPTYDGEPV